MRAVRFAKRWRKHPTQYTYVFVHRAVGCTFFCTARHFVLFQGLI